MPDARSDTGSMFLLPASKAASYIAASAFASSRLLGDLIESLDMTRVEAALGSCWQGALLQRGQVFHVPDIGDCLSPGSHAGYAVLVWQLSTFTLPSGRKCFSMKASCRVLWCCGGNCIMSTRPVLLIASGPQRVTPSLGQRFKPSVFRCVWRISH